MAAAICDFAPAAMEIQDDRTEAMETTAFGKDQPRLHHARNVILTLRPSEKILAGIKPQRPEILLVSFKTTAGCSQQEMVRQALENAQKTHSDLVLANDVQTHQNLVVQSDGQYWVGETREEALRRLCEGIIERLVTP
jgi:phosphopantothenoylcysteine synthetase/decarboxylase